MHAGSICGDADRVATTAVLVFVEANSHVVSLIERDTTSRPNDISSAVALAMHRVRPCAAHAHARTSETPDCRPSAGAGAVLMVTTAVRSAGWMVTAMRDRGSCVSDAAREEEK